MGKGKTQPWHFQGNHSIWEYSLLDILPQELHLGLGKYDLHELIFPGWFLGMWDTGISLAKGNKQGHGKGNKQAAPGK